MRHLVPLAVAIVLLAAGSARAQDDSDDTSLDDIPHVTMVGTAHVDVVPDLAVISLGVVTEKPTAIAATDATARKATAVVDAAKSEGIAPADIQTQALSLIQTYDDLHDASGRYTGRKPRGYEASNTIAIRVRDLPKAGALAQSLIEKGADRLDGIAFSVEHPEAALASLAGDAVKDARMQAESAATAAGVKLGRVLKIERPGSGDTPGPIPFAQMRAKAVAGPASMPVEAGTTEQSASVVVTWALAP